MKKFAFDFDTQGLSDYLNANADLLLSKIVLDTTEAQYYKVVPDIKFGSLIPVYETGEIDTLAYPGNGCQFSGGTITLEERELKVCQYNIERSWCDNDLNRTIMSIRLKPGSYQPNLDASVEESFMNDIAKKANVYASRKFWGATTAVDGCSGIIEQLESAALSGSVVNITYSALTGANVSVATQIVDQYYLSIPENLKTTTTILSLNHQDYSALQIALRNQNLFQFNPVELTNGMMAIQYPFTNMIVISTEIGSGYATITNAENFMLGTDLLSDISSPVSWFSLDFQQTRLRLSMKLGAAIGFASQVVFAS
jgi:hypothetical protein